VIQVEVDDTHIEPAYWIDEELVVQEEAFLHSRNRHCSHSRDMAALAVVVGMQVD
jgi:hypothetical protein